MDVIALTSRKGGCGKTTTAVQWGVLSSQTQRTALVELDHQGSLTQWWKLRREAAEEFEIEDEGKLDAFDVPALELGDFLDDCEEEGIEVVLIDTRPEIDAAARAAIQQADFVVVPCNPSLYDIAAIGETLELASSLSKPSGIVLTRAPASSSVARQCRSILDDYQVPVCPHPITERVVYTRTAFDGLGVVEENPKSKASRDVRKTWDWTKEQLELSRQDPTP